MSGKRSPAAYQNSLELSRLAKRRRRGRCVDCGATTRYGGKGAKPAVSERCHSCASALQAKWSQESIIGAIQRFAAENGRPPVAAEWAYKKTKPDYAPYLNTVRDVFGSWAAGIVAAGFPQPRIGAYQRNPRPNDRPHVVFDDS